MAKVYEALRRAEEERKRKIRGDAAPVAAVEWDPTPQTAPRRNRFAFWKRWLGQPSEEVVGGDALNKRRISMLQPESFASEQFRTLRARIDSLGAQHPMKTIALTSPNMNEGKSTAAINLAIVTAMGVGRQVLLIDCDMRRPSIHLALGLQPKAGLAEVLLDRVGFADAILKVEGLNLDVLPVHAIPSNPSELLASTQMRNLIEEASRSYDRIILDTPATLGIPDAKIVSELCDGLALVVRADRTPREDIQSALEILDRHRLLGMVLNDARVASERYYY